MSQIVIPRTGVRLHGRTPTIHQYVQDYLTKMRAPLREKTVFTPAGRTVLHSDGELIIYSPRGEPILVVEKPEGGTQVEHGDHLHAHVRPQCVTKVFEVG